MINPLRRGLLAAALVTLALPAQAQSWPTKPITFIVPFAAGGGTDTFARPIAAKIEAGLGQRIVIENRAGAGGTTGAAAAAKAAPDGYTFFIGATHHTIAPAIYPKLSYDFLADFEPVAMLARPPHVVVVNPAKVPARTLADLVKMAQAEPDKRNYASAGAGTTHHLAGELFKQLTKSRIAHVPYRGAGPAMQDLIAGHVDMAFDGLGSSAGPIAAGQIVALAVAAPKRVPSLPNVPTAAEAGVAGFDVATWYAVFAPKGTPADIIARMTAEIGKALKDPAIVQLWERNGTDVPDVTGAALGKLATSETQRWSKVVAESGVKLAQ